MPLVVEFKLKLKVPKLPLFAYQRGPLDRYNPGEGLIHLAPPSPSPYICANSIHPSCSLWHSNRFAWPYCKPTGKNTCMIKRYLGINNTCCISSKLIKTVYVFVKDFSTAHFKFVVLLKNYFNFKYGNLKKGKWH